MGSTSDQLVGTINLETLKTIPSPQWTDYQVEDFLRPMKQETRIQAEKPLLDAIQQLENQGIQSLAVTQENGTLVGLLGKAEIFTLLRQRTQTKVA